MAIVTIAPHTHARHYRFVVIAKPLAPSGESSTDASGGGGGGPAARPRGRAGGMSSRISSLQGGVRSAKLGMPC